MAALLVDDWQPIEDNVMMPGPSNTGPGLACCGQQNTVVGPALADLCCTRTVYALSGLLSLN